MSADANEDVSALVAQIAADGLKAEPVKDNPENYPTMAWGKETEGKLDGSELKPTHLFVPRQVTNRHIARRLDLNITLIRYLRTPEKKLDEGLYYARMHFDPAKSTPMNIDGEIGLAKSTSMGVIISKRWSSVWTPEPNTAIALVEVADPKQCLFLS